MIKAQFMTYAATNNVTKKAFFFPALFLRIAHSSLYHAVGQAHTILLYHLADYIMSHEVTVSEESCFSNKLLVQPPVACNVVSFLQTHSVSYMQPLPETVACSHIVFWLI